mmetsp:Transcript_62208/g.144732  ORF Transcript_62208/g.144732 Transcript_62208/m.144732 type:complete len:212 (+) Transcript_62208:942-1577(+)
MELLGRDLGCGVWHWWWDGHGAHPCWAEGAPSSLHCHDGNDPARPLVKHCPGVHLPGGSPPGLLNLPQCDHNFRGAGRQGSHRALGTADWQGLRACVGPGGHHHCVHCAHGRPWHCEGVQEWRQGLRVWQPLPFGRRRPPPIFPRKPHGGGLRGSSSRAAVAFPPVGAPMGLPVHVRMRLVARDPRSNGGCLPAMATLRWTAATDPPSSRH